jgi:hypothetical protein
MDQTTGQAMEQVLTADGSARTRRKKGKKGKKGKET